MKECMRCRDSKKIAIECLPCLGWGLDVCSPLVSPAQECPTIPCPSCQGEEEEEESND